jgi:hypothetical protein
LCEDVPVIARPASNYPHRLFLPRITKRTHVLRVSVNGDIHAVWRWQPLTQSRPLEPLKLVHSAVKLALKCPHKRVLRILREDNLLAVQPRAFVVTPIPSTSWRSI